MTRQQPATPTGRAYVAKWPEGTLGHTAALDFILAIEAEIAAPQPAETVRWSTDRRPEDDADCVLMECEDRSHPIHRSEAAAPQPAEEVLRMVYEAGRNAASFEAALERVQATLEQDTTGMADDIRALANQPTAETAGLDVEATIAQLAKDLQSTVLVGNPAPIVEEMDERMRDPHPGDLVWEHTTRPGRVAILDAIVQEAVASEEDWDGDLPIPTERVYYVRRLSGEPERWVDAEFLSLGPARLAMSDPEAKVQP